MLNRFAYALLLVALSLAAGLVVHAQSSSGLNLAAIDRSADACTDFYQFTCGGWIAKNPIPPDRSSWGVAEELIERNNEILKGILERAASGRDADEKQIGDYYASCMDEAAINEKGAGALGAQMDAIASLSSAADLPPLLGQLHQIGVGAFFTFSSDQDFKDASSEIAETDQGGLGLPERDYYLRTDDKSAELRQQYSDHIRKMFVLLGSSPDDAKSAADTVMGIETTLAKASLDVVARRDPSAVYHKMTMADLQSMTPRFDWKRYLAAVDAPPAQSINVTAPDFFKAFGQLLTSTPPADLRVYLRWQLAHAWAHLLSKPFVDENFRFFGTTLTGAPEQRPRWKRCVSYTDNDLGEALGKAFVKVAFPPEAKADTLEMVRDLESALRKDITALPWMTEATKQQALVKLDAIANKIGYPDKWRDYSALKIARGDAMGNSQRATAFEFHRQLNKIGKPVDRSEWGMTPPTVNAYYSPQFNDINFPAGILQPPFFSPKYDAAVNFGGSGTVIGHELTHGFDDEGRQFDAQGNLKDWWTPADAKAFDERAQCIVDEYSSFTAVDDVKLNGKLTLGENAADNGGTRIALMAYLASTAAKPSKTEDGFTPEQRFFVAYGQGWCEVRRPEVERLLAQTNPHSPSKYRVNGVLSNIPEFQKAFACKADAPMVRKPACRVW